MKFCSCACLLLFLFPVLFSPSVYSFYFLISLIVFFSNLLSFLFSFPINLFCLLLPDTLLLFNLFSFQQSSSFQIPLSNTSLLSVLLQLLFSVYFFFLLRIYDTSCSVFLPFFLSFLFLSILFPFFLCFLFAFVSTIFLFSSLLAFICYSCSYY